MSVNHTIYARIAIITVSDRAYRGEYDDMSGPAISDYLTPRLLPEVEYCRSTVPDVISNIAEAIIDHVNREHCCLVITTGGTGPQPRDVTPEATRLVCDKILPGFGERMRLATCEKVPSAIVSRQIAGVRGKSIVLNLPGSPRAIADCLDAVFAALVHATRLVSGISVAKLPEHSGIPPH